MRSPDEINHAIFCAPLHLFAEVRESLLALSDKLFAVAEAFKGELGGTARIAWLFAHEPDPRTPRDLRVLIGEVESTLSFLENWFDCVRSSFSEDDESWGVIRTADAAAERAKLALHALVDHLRTAR